MKKIKLEKEWAVEMTDPRNEVTCSVSFKQE